MGALDACRRRIRSGGDERPTDRFFARTRILARLLMIVSGLLGGYLAASACTGRGSSAAVASSRRHLARCRS
jgi:hypothetical protein